jgi:hypothetical protein
LVKRLTIAGALVSTHPDLTKPFATSEQPDVVLVFADGLPAPALVAGLELLERMPAGPVLVVVSDRPPAWTPKVKRERLAIVVTDDAWLAQGVGLLQLSVTSTDYSGPELPFTD